MYSRTDPNDVAEGADFNFDALQHI